MSEMAVSPLMGRQNGIMTHMNEPIPAAPAKRQLSPAADLKKRKKKKTYGWWLTALMLAVLVSMMSVIWALFISGPANIHNMKIEQAESVMEENVPDVENLSRHLFDYVTWTGNTSDTLYWFDASGAVITSRDMSSLNYTQARETARSDYGMEADTIELAYGYSGPVYQLENSQKILMLDYDSLAWVYERNTDYD